MSFSHILVAYDGSVPSIQALDKAITMVEHSPAAQLTVVHVYSIPSMAIADSIVTIPTSMQKEEFLQAQALMEEVDAKLSYLPFAGSALLQGSPAESILHYAQEHNCDLIVMGNHGQSAIREFVMGSVSHYVIQHTSVPLMLVK